MHKEMLLLRGLAGHIQAMKYPKLSAIKNIAEDVGFIILNQKDYEYQTFGKTFKVYSEALRYATIKILELNSNNKPEELINFIFIG